MQKRLASVLLAIVMISGGMTMSMPGPMPADLTVSMPGPLPAYAATANLFVSAENPTFDNHFGGPMVIEVVVNDPDLKDTDESEGEPDVTLNGQTLQMLQASDGNWYAYFADRDSAVAADGLINLPGSSMDFGRFCTVDELQNGGTRFSETDGLFLAYNTCDLRSVQGEPSLDMRQNVIGDPNDSIMNVVREPKEPSTGNAGTAATSGQIGVTNWPVIQLFEFTADGNVEIQYNKGGAPQEIDLVYTDSMDDFAELTLDRQSYPRHASVHITISDMQLNIDPTDEDSWSFATNSHNPRAYYQLFDENGDFDTPWQEYFDANHPSLATGNQVSGAKLPDLTSLEHAAATAEFNAPDISAGYDSIDFGDNGLLILDPNANDACCSIFNGKPVNVLALLNNTDQQLENVRHPNPLGGNNDLQLTAGVQWFRTGALEPGSMPVTVVETQSNTGIFKNTDEGDIANILITEIALRDTTATIDYNDSPQSILVSYDTAIVDFHADDIGAEWNSGEPIDIEVHDEDANLNSLVDDELELAHNGHVGRIPAIIVGEPFSPTPHCEADIRLPNGNPFNPDGDAFVGNHGPKCKVPGHVPFVTATFINETASDLFRPGNPTHNLFHHVEISQFDYVVRPHYHDVHEVTDTADLYADPENPPVGSVNAGFVNVTFFDKTHDDLAEYAGAIEPSKFILFNYDIRVFEPYPRAEPNNKAFDIILQKNDQGASDAITLVEGTRDYKGLIDVTSIVGDGGVAGDEDVEISFVFASNITCAVGTCVNAGFIEDYAPFVVDFFRFGLSEDGSTRYNDAIYRVEGHETGDNTGHFHASLEYLMLNQINIHDVNTYLNRLEPVEEDVVMVVHEDLTDEDAVRVNYNDFDGQGANTIVSAQMDAPTHDGVVTFDSDNYKIADTVTITLVDQDLNTDVDTIDVYTVVRDIQSPVHDAVGDADVGASSRLLDVTFDDQPWLASNKARMIGGNQVTCEREPNADDGLAATGFTLRETSAQSGEFVGTFQVPSEVCVTRGSSVVVEPSTGLDMEVNYVDFRDASGEELEVGDSAGIRANTGSISFDRTVYPVPWGPPSDEPGASTFALHENVDGHLPQGDICLHIRVNDPDFDVSANGEDTISLATAPVKVTITRGSQSVVVATAGDAATPIKEIAPDAGIFQIDLDIYYNDGPADPTCPAGLRETGCILQGDIVTVEYTDPTDASGSVNTVTDSATFDLRNGVLQTDKSVYIIGSDMILTLIEPDFDLIGDSAETYDLDLINWDSDAFDNPMGELGGMAGAFDPEPFALRETGDSTGIFQSVIEIPSELDEALDRGEEIELEYTDWGPAGANYVGDEDEDINLTVFTSNFGATIELDQKVYTWTDKVFITVVAPDHNFDTDLVDEIGSDTGDEDPIRIATSDSELENYKLVETGTDTGIFSGEVILTGYPTHDADGDGQDGDASGQTSGTGAGPTDGLLRTDDEDGISVSFEFSEDETVVGSALIRWNIGEVEWLEASYPATGTGVVRVVDPDMNLNPEAVDNFEIDVASDSDAAGIDLTVTETNEATGIFEGTVDFVIEDSSSGHRLRVAEGDSITAEYEDHTLPDPYNPSDEIEVTASAIIGTIVPPLERAPATAARIVDSQGNTLGEVGVDQQVQIQADLTNGQDRDQQFAYLVQIQDDNGVTVSLSWIEGNLEAGQSFSPSQSWTPSESGSYDISIFVWESITNPTALSPALDLSVIVN